jgi:hypothetical protein
VTSLKHDPLQQDLKGGGDVTFLKKKTKAGINTKTCYLVFHFKEKRGSFAYKFYLTQNEKSRILRKQDVDLFTNPSVLLLSLMLAWMKRL